MPSMGTFQLLTPPEGTRLLVSIPITYDHRKVCFWAWRPKRARSAPPITRSFSRSFCSMQVGFALGGRAARAR